MKWPTPAEHAAVAHLRREHEALASRFAEVGRVALSRAMPPGDVGPMFAEFLQAAVEQRPAMWKGLRFDRGVLVRFLEQSVREGHVGDAQGRAALWALEAAEAAAWCLGPCFPDLQALHLANSRQRLADLADRAGVVLTAVEPAPLLA